MNKLLMIGSALLVSACGSSGKGDEAAAVASSAPTEAAEAMPTAAPQPSPSGVASVAATTSAVKDVWRCDGGKFKVEFTALSSRTNPRGGDEVNGNYRIKGENYLGIPSSGEFYMKGAAYVLGSVWLQPSDDGKSIWWEYPETGDIVECVK